MMHIPRPVKYPPESATSHFSPMRPLVRLLCRLLVIFTDVVAFVCSAANHTAMRTPAVTALSAAALAPNTEYFGMYGAGVQGKEHLRYIPRTLKKLKKIYLYGPHDDTVDAIITEAEYEAINAA